MKNRDYLWCLVNDLLDREEELEALCPACRERAMDRRCPVCGGERGDWEERVDNPHFDPKRFEAMKKGEGA